MKKSDYNYLVKLVEKKLGWKFSFDRYYMINKKISSFVSLKNYASIDALIEDIKFGNKFLIEDLSEKIAYSDTCFFRDVDVFSRFETLVLPKIKSMPNNVKKKLYIWSCGCSSGQEVYSILILLKKIGFLKDWQVSVTGTDFSSKALAVASKGVYNNFEVQTGNNIKTILENFDHVEAGWKIKEDVAKYAEFRKFNLLDEPLFNNRMEIVFCRNTLKYFTPNNQKNIVKKIFLSQPVGGLLYVGLGEDIVGLLDYYDKVKGFECLYSAKENPVILEEE